MEKKDLRIVFMGTPEFAVGTLSRLIDEGYHVVAVVTQPDKPVGRHQNVLSPPPVKTFALAHQLPVLQPEKMKDPAFLEELARYKADIQVVVAFRMLPEVVWAMPRYGTFNVHAALLPQYRGAAPINWAIIHGETETGVTTFFLDHDIDTGRIILQKPFPIPDEADVEYVYNGLMALGAEAACDTLQRLILADGQIEATPQTAYMGAHTTLRQAPKLFKDNCRISWSITAREVYNFVRGLSPIPTAWTELNHNGQTTPLKVFKTGKTHEPTHNASPGTIRTEKGRLYVACHDEWLEILDLQLAGKKRMAARDFLNGNKNLGEGSCMA